MARPVRRSRASTPRLPPAADERTPHEARGRQLVARDGRARRRGRPADRARRGRPERRGRCRGLGTAASAPVDGLPVAFVDGVRRVEGSCGAHEVPAAAVRQAAAGLDRGRRGLLRRRSRHRHQRRGATSARRPGGFRAAADPGGALRTAGRRRRRSRRTPARHAGASAAARTAVARPTRLARRGRRGRAAGARRSARRLGRGATRGRLRQDPPRGLPAREVRHVVGALQPGERTPLFLAQSSWTRYSWYLRLPYGGDHPWAGIVRCEASADVGPAEAAGSPTSPPDCCHGSRRGRTRTAEPRRTCTRSPGSSGTSSACSATATTCCAPFGTRRRGSRPPPERRVSRRREVSCRLSVRWSGSQVPRFRREHPEPALLR